MIEKDKSVKHILMWGDTPTGTTGFGNVMRNIIKILLKTGKYKITLVGINYYGDPYDKGNLPIDIWPAIYPGGPNDVYGRARFLGFIRAMRPDIVFMLQDTFIVQSIMKTLLELQEEQNNSFKTVLYYPIDAKPRKEWITEVVSKVDYPVAYTEYAARETLAVDPELSDLRVIYHGTDKNIFFPIPKEARENARKVFFGVHADKFIVINVNRNQPRKDMQKTLAAFAEFHAKNPNSLLYILAKQIDVGGDLAEMAKTYGLEYGVDWSCPPNERYSEANGIPVEQVNLIYNSADAIISTTLGEGWGLSCTEGMACGRPVVFPKHTSLVEIIGASEQRGTFIRSGGIDHTICLGAGDNNLTRPIVHVSDLAARLAHMAKNPKAYEKKAERALEWVPSWDDVAQQWHEVFDLASGVENE